MYRGTTNVEPEMYDYTSINWCHWNSNEKLNRLAPNDPYMGRTAPLNSKHCILYIYSTNAGTEYFNSPIFSSKCSSFHNANLFGSCIIHIFIHALYSPFFSLQNTVCFITLTYLVPVLFTFYIQGVLKLKKIIPAPKG